MSRRVAVSLEVPGVRIAYEGGTDLYEALVRGMVTPIARARFVPSPASLPPEAAPAPSPAHVPPAPASAGPAAVRAPAAVSAPAPSFDPGPALARLAAEGGRRAEREAVLLALAGLASEGRRDATAAEVSAWLESRGFPVDDLKPRPILAKLCHRKGQAVPGLLPGTYRATPSGAAQAFRIARS